MDAEELCRFRVLLEEEEDEDPPRGEVSASSSTGVTTLREWVVSVGWTYDSRSSRPRAVRPSPFANAVPEPVDW